MAKGDKPERAPNDKSHGEHGGNRGPDQKDTDQVKRSSQAAGKDPHRGDK